MTFTISAISTFASSLFDDEWRFLPLFTPPVTWVYIEMSPGLRPDLARPQGSIFIGNDACVRAVFIPSLP